MTYLLTLGLLFTSLTIVVAQPSGQNFSRVMRYVSDTLVAEEDDMVFFQGMLFAAYGGVAFPVKVEPKAITCAVLYSPEGVREITLQLNGGRKPLQETISAIESIVTTGDNILVATKEGEMFSGNLPSSSQPRHTVPCSLTEPEKYITQFFPINDSLAGIIDFSIGNFAHVGRGSISVIGIKGAPSRTWPYPTKNGQILNSNQPFQQICADADYIYYIDAITYQILRKKAGLSDEPWIEVGKGTLMPYKEQFYETFDTLTTVIETRKMFDALDREKSLDGERITSCFIHQGYLFVCKLPYSSRAKKSHERYWDVWEIAPSRLRLAASNLADWTMDERPSTMDDNYVSAEHFAPISVGDYVYTVSVHNAGMDIRSGKSPKASIHDLISTMAGADLYQFYLVRRRLDTSTLAK
ncbi:MAG: hypothetical protein MUC47_10710 [Candidatus Kapabacteria bacterium]|nr:hypothetical protein [Candidatus Kapabacteria bacterium]